MFEIDYSQAKEFASITDGTYETFVEKAVQDKMQLKTAQTLLTSISEFAKTSSRNFKITLFFIVSLPKKKMVNIQSGQS